MTPEEIQRKLGFRVDVRSEDSGSVVFLGFDDKGGIKDRAVRPASTVEIAIWLELMSMSRVIWVDAHSVKDPLGTPKDKS